MNEDKAARYHRLRRRALLQAACWRVFLLAALLVSRLGHVLRDASIALVQPLPASLHLPGAVVVWVAAVGAVHEAGALPMAFFSGFVLERRYGLSRQSVFAWFRDYVRAGMVNLALAATAAAWIYVWLARAPGYWWGPAWAGLSLAAVVIAWAAPVVLLPVFFRFVPLAEGPLRARLLALAAGAGVPAIGVFEWRTSDRTTRANAALAGLGCTRRIILSDTLLAGYSPEEVEAVVAHEMAHHLNGDLWRTLALNAASDLAALVLAHLALTAAAGPLALQGTADPAGLPVVGLALAFAAWLARPFQTAVSRRLERRADRAALDLTNNPGAFAAAMRRLGAMNLAEESPALFARLFFQTHPPVGERVAAAQARGAAQAGLRDGGG